MVLLSDGSYVLHALLLAMLEQMGMSTPYVVRPGRRQYEVTSII